MATLEDAIQIAAQAHSGQKDKAGAPYLLHPLRMMIRMKSEEAINSYEFYNNHRGS